MDPLQFLYEEKTNKFKEIFGDLYIGPEVFHHAEHTLIAKIPKSDEDGKDVEIYATLYPALFFRIEEKDEFGTTENIITTGSGDEELTRWCLQTAVMLSDNTIAINKR